MNKELMYNSMLTGEEDNLSVCVLRSYVIYWFIPVECVCGRRLGEVLVLFFSTLKCLIETFMFLLTLKCTLSA